MNARTRLISGTGPNGEHVLGVDIELAKNWKTYWRNPGDAGIPPLFDFSGSKNVAATNIAYPVPHRLEDPAGEAIGYKDKVVFPITIVAAEPGKPVDVALKLNYAVCEVLCIPVEQELTLRLPVKPDDSPEVLTRSLAAVPSAATGTGTPRIAKVSRGQEQGKPHLTVDVLHAKDAAKVDLFAEGPQDWYMPLPREMARHETADGVLVTYDIDLSHLPKTAKVGGTEMTFTMAAGNAGTEQTVNLP